MPHTIKMLISGLRKDDIIEDGEFVKRKLFRGEIVQVASIDESEMQSGYYKVVRRKITGATRIERGPDQSSGNAEQLSQLIQNMKQMTSAAEAVLSNITQQKTEKPEQENEVPKKILVDENDDGVPEEFVMDEDDEDYEIYDEEKFKEGNERYTQLMENTLGHAMGLRSVDDNATSSSSAQRNVFKRGNWKKKSMPTVSEAKVGHRITQPKPVLFDKDGKVANSVSKINGKTNNKKIQVVKDTKGNIDVIKSLGLQPVSGGIL